MVISRIAVVALSCFLAASSCLLGDDTTSSAGKAPFHPAFKVSVTGQVKFCIRDSDRAFEIEVPSNENLTVSQAIVKAGGFGDVADKRRVELLRKKPDGSLQKTKVDVTAFLRGHSTIDPVLQADDVVNVSCAFINQ